MFSLFTVLLSFSSALACIAKVSDRTKRLFLNEEPCMVRRTLIDLYPVEHKYHPFIISLYKFTKSCNVVSLKIFVSKETKYINIEAFNIITNKNNANSMTEHISCDCKCKFNSKICNLNQTWNNETYQYEYKNYCTCKKVYSCNLLLAIILLLIVIIIWQKSKV